MRKLFRKRETLSDALFMFVQIDKDRVLIRSGISYGRNRPLYWKLLFLKCQIGRNWF